MLRPPQPRGVGERGPGGADAARSNRCAALGLPLGDFRCRFAVASLHLWLTLVRLRAEGDEGKRLGQARSLHSLRSLALGAAPCMPGRPHGAAAR